MLVSARTAHIQQDCPLRLQSNACFPGSKSQWTEQTFWVVMHWIVLLYFSSFPHWCIIVSFVFSSLHEEMRFMFSSPNFYLQPRILLSSLGLLFCPQPWLLTMWPGGLCIFFQSEILFFITGYLLHWQDTCGLLSSPMIFIHSTSKGFLVGRWGIPISGTAEIHTTHKHNQPWLRRLQRSTRLPNVDPKSTCQVDLASYLAQQEIPASHLWYHFSLDLFHTILCKFIWK